MILRQDEPSCLSRPPTHLAGAPAGPLPRERFSPRVDSCRSTSRPSAVEHEALSRAGGGPASACNPRMIVPEASRNWTRNCIVNAREDDRPPRPSPASVLLGGSGGSRFISIRVAGVEPDRLACSLGHYAPSAAISG
jgi:hypothetical protein